ncbi:hypothetical protein PACTADRAFT_49595 [Pachysolen tannophilus NRRL Y-2460]|uniref:Uncharacterized protein n=1 Tax=Pachysolen tannophilus NRRL Y-2460 TaxID=669874 RepID=A0A1E4TWU9_PACTA|nr:hypothetical protein PACTADRAFT_49595 [Pachysolen tannophilus NRRL Y-2460]
MPARDSQKNYIHMSNSHHVLYLERWINDKLPFNDIDFNAILLQQQQSMQFQNSNFLKNAILIDEEDEEELASNRPYLNQQFGGSANINGLNGLGKKLLTNNIWQDLDLQIFLNEANNNNSSGDIRDNTILKHLNKQALSVDNDHNNNDTSGTNDDSFDFDGDDSDDDGDNNGVPLNTKTDEANDIVMRSASTASDLSSTPISRNTRKNHYQTPITRIIR